jgi:hypothetical protein
MRKPAPAKLFPVLLAAAVVAANGYGQRERLVPPPSQTSTYGPQFFDQLRRLSGHFSDSDLHHVFQRSRPIQCSELVRDNGEWQDVAFFSGNRKFGSWYRANLDEVTSNVAAFAFESGCSYQQAPLRLTTKFPMNEGAIDEDGTRDFREAPVKVNPPVNVAFSIYTKAYTFDLPYLFRGRDANGSAIYTFSPRGVSDRYLTHVISHWECKALNEEYLTYQFLVCHTQLFGYEPTDIKPDRETFTASFGGAAYFILSNGKEASSSF